MDEQEEFELFYKNYIKNLFEEERFVLIDGMNMLLWDLSAEAHVKLFRFIALKRTTLLPQHQPMMDEVMKVLTLPGRFEELLKQRN